jgi:hypothetical protein
MRQERFAYANTALPKATCTKNASDMPVRGAVICEKYLSNIRQLKKTMRSGRAPGTRLAENSYPDGVKVFRLPAADCWLVAFASGHESVRAAARREDPGAG